LKVFHKATTTEPGETAPEKEENGESAPEKDENMTDSSSDKAAAEPAIKKAEVSENGDRRDRRNDQNDKFDLKVKPEYVLTERAKSLGPVPEPTEEEASEDLSQRQSGKKKKNKKKRPRDVRQDDSEKVCLSVIRNTKCPWGETCKFSHDLKAYMATRPTDITTVEGGCPNFNNHGHCVYGTMCRLGSVHITKTGENVHKEAASDEAQSDVKAALVPLPEAATNLLPKDVQVQLRKKKYSFACKQHFEKKKKDPDANGNDESKKEEKASNEASSSSTPVELKTRKIIDFSNKVYVAPLTTVGNLPFRRIMKKFGADITCGEMALATNLLDGKTSEWALMKRHPEEDVFGVQIAAAHADQFTRVSELIEEYTAVDFVDLNLGCPLDLVCSKGAGASLMMRHQKLKAALEGISSTLSCPITVKIRTGWDMNKPFAHQLVPRIQSWQIPGIGAIMVSCSFLSFSSYDQVAMHRS
jgi:tRNA-dihydrouridine synthase 3